MSFDWTSDDENPSLPEGYHKVEITAVKTAKKDGAVFTSKNNERMVWATLEDLNSGDKQDVCLMIEGNGVFNLRKLLKYSGANVEKMKADGVEPIRFGEPAFAKAQLVGRKVWVYAESKGGRINLDFRKEEDVPAQVVKEYRGQPEQTKAPAMAGAGHKPLDDENIPF